jgi:tetratricopeptide (TPR) repeat protein
MLSSGLGLLLPFLVVTVNPWHSSPPPLPAPVVSHLRVAADALTRGDADAAIAAVQAELQRDPDSAPAHELLGAAFLAKRDLKRAEAALSRARTLDGKRVPTLLLLGHLALLQDRATEAAQHFEKAAALEPSSIPARRGLAAVALRRGDLRQALALLEAAVQLSGGKDDETNLSLASIYYDLGRLPDVERTLGPNPTLDRARVLLGLSRADQGRREDALPLLESVAREQRDTFMGRLARTIAHRLKGELPQALAELAELRQQQPSWAVARVLEAEVRLALPDLSGALAAYRKAIELAPSRPLMTLRMVRALLARGYRTEAEKELERQVSGRDHIPESFLLLAELYAGDVKPDRAEALLRQAAGRFPKDPRIPNQLGTLLAQRGRPGDGATHLETAVRLAPSWAEPRARLAEVYARQGQAQKARASGEEASKLLGETAEAAHFLGLLEEHLRDFAAAERYYQLALQRQPDLLSAGLRLALLSVRDGRDQEAEARLRRLATTHPTSPLPYVHLGDLLSRAGQSAEARDAYRAALARDPDNIAALNNLAWTLGKDGANLDEALALAERAYERAPRVHMVADTLGWLAFHRGDLERAATLLRQAVAADPDRPTYRYHLGLVLAKQGRTAEAARELRRALATPEFPEAAAARKALDALAP